MKWCNLRKVVLMALVLVASVLISLAVPEFAQRVRAEGPQPYVYPMVKCSGLSVATLVVAEQDFDTQYGWDHDLVTDWQWRASYEARVNEFAASLGCPSVIDDGQLTLWYRVYVPTYGRILRNVPE